MTPLPTLRQLQFLRALRAEGSFHAAAAACLVTQSTLSAGIQEMEATLGSPVIDRATRKGVRFTRLGETLLVEAAMLLDRLGAVVEQARRAARPFAWPLRLGIIPTVAPYWLPRLLKPLQAAFPHLGLHLHELQSAALVEQVAGGQLDVGLLALPYDTRDLQVLDLHAEEFRIAAAAGQFPAGAPLDLDDIADRRLLLLADGHCLRDHALTACDLKQTDAASDVSATSLATLIQLVAQDYGVTLLPAMVADDPGLPPGVATWPVSPVPPGRRIAAVWRRKAPQEQDCVTLALAIYRLVRGRAVGDDSCNPP